MGKRFFILTIAAAACVGWLAPAQGATQADYTGPALQQFMSTGTLAGLAQAYQTLNNGMNDATVTGDKRQLVLLHAVTRTGMLVFDTGDVSVTTSLLEVMEPLGVTITGHKFFPSDPSDADRIQLHLPTNPADSNCLQFPAGANIDTAATAINNHILVELNAILTELNQVTNSPAFTMILTAAQTGRESDVEVDYSDVLAFKAGLLAIKAFLYGAANVAYDVQVDLANAIFAGWECGHLPDATTINTILSAYPNLGEVLAGTGTTKLTQTKTNLVVALDAVMAAMDSIMAETDDQTTDLLQIASEDRASNTAMRAELLKLRNSVANGTAATYTLGSDQEFDMRQSGIVIGKIGLRFDPPTNEPRDGWFSLSDPGELPGWWKIDWFSVNAGHFNGNVSTEGTGTSFWGWFEGNISADGSSITNMTFNWNTWSDNGQVTGLSASRTYNQPVTLTFNPGPIFAGTVSPRDMLPQFDPNGKPIATTMAHGLNNDATMTGTFPGMTQKDWIPYGYEVWGGNTDYTQEGSGQWPIFANIGRHGYTKLGESSGGSRTFSGTYAYYVIGAKGKTKIDAIKGSTGVYVTGEPWVGNVGNPQNLTGQEDGQFAKVGNTDFMPMGGDQFSGYVVVTNPGGQNAWSSVRVITAGAEPVVTAAASPSSVAANGTTASTITITVKDTYGDAQPGVLAASIVVSATGTGNTITQPTGVTNASGQITATIRSTVAETKHINVALDGDAFNEVATVVFGAGAANKLVFTAQPVGPYTAGGTINAIPKVAVEDAQGNIITSSTASITMAIGTNPGSGTLSGTKVHAAESGVATFSGLSINKAGTGYTLQATSPGLTSAVSNAFNIIADASTAHLVFTTQPGNSPALGALTPAPVVTVQDSYGNTVATVNPDVTLAIKAGTGDAGATLSGTTTVTASSGVATFNNVQINRAGESYQVTASGTGVAGTATSAAFNVTALPAMTIQKSHQPDHADPNADIEYTITYGNTGLAAAHNVVIRETLPSGMEFRGAGNEGSNTGGVITWNIGTVDANSTGHTVTFTARATQALADGGSVVNSNLTIVCDGAQAVSQVTPDVTHINDGKAPEVSGQIPEPNSASAALDPMIRLHVTDGGSGVAYGSGTVKIYVNEDLIYNGDAESPSGIYDSTDAEQDVRGICRRTGDPNDYTFTFLPTTKFKYEQLVDVSVHVADVSSNTDTVNYSFHTQLRSFGENAKVNSDTGTAIQDNPAVATDLSGNIWVVWDQKATTSATTDVYVAKLPVDGNAFGSSVLIYNNDQYQSNPAIAADSTGRLYAVWEQWGGTDPNHHIMMASSTDGVHWVSDPCTPPSQVDPNSADHPRPLVVARNPSIAITSANLVCIAWEATSNGAKSDIWLRTFTQAGGFNNATQITTDANDQTEPFVGVDPNSVVYVLWTDARTPGTTKIWRAAGNLGPWTNAPLIATTGNKSHPTGATASREYHAWVDGNDLMYAYQGMSPAASILDPNEPKALPGLPVLAAAQMDTGDRIYAAWVDSRNVVGTNGDTDIYFAEAGSPFGTNILVNDDTGVHKQSKPAMGVDGAGNPYIVWVDNRGGNDDIYYAGATAIKTPLETTVHTDEGGASTVQGAENLEVQVPANALPAGVLATDISIAEVANLPAPPTGGFGMAYSFGPSGVVFPHPVTIRIPLAADAPVYSVYTVYRYDAGTGTWTQEGIHNPATKAADGSYLEVQVDHFTTFIAGGAAAGSHHGGGGGCALSPWSNAGPIEVILPFAVCVLALLTWSIVSGLRRRSGGSRD